MLRVTKLTISTIVIVLLLLPLTAGAATFKEVNKTFFGVAIKGYDSVAYHTEGRAVKGDSKYSYTWNDAKWYFTSNENMDRFIKDPEKYAPQYGGY